MVHQTYQTDVNLEHVIRGNSAVLKCSVPSFIADFVTVDAWLVDDDHVVHGDSMGNKTHLLAPASEKLSLLPSHHSKNRAKSTETDGPNFFLFCFLLIENVDFDIEMKMVVVQSSYVVEVNNEHVILGNAAMLKCTIPSFVTDFVFVASWTISDERGELANLDTHSSGISLHTVFIF